jgi:hypothetical protein
MVSARPATVKNRDSAGNVAITSGSASGELPTAMTPISPISTRAKTSRAFVASENNPSHTIFQRWDWLSTLQMPRTEEKTLHLHFWLDREKLLDF